MNLHKRRSSAALVALAALALPALAVDNLLTDPGFEGPPAGAGWGIWGNTDFNTFFGPDVHASLYGDWWNNSGGVYQLGIPGLPATAYQFSLHNVRIEANWDAELMFGFECYAADDGTKLGEVLVLADTAARLANNQIDGNVLTMQGTTVPGTAFVRPIFSFNNVNIDYVEEPQANTFVFNTFLNVAPAPADEHLKNPGFEDLNADGAFGDYWGSWGTTGFHEFFGPGNAHLSFFADTVGNMGGAWQQGVLGEAGREYRLVLADVRLEANWDADLYAAIEYFGGDDYVKLGETAVLLDTSQPGDNLQFVITGTAVLGTVYVRPYIHFDNVGYSGGTQRNAFVFSASLAEVVAPTVCRGDCNCDGNIGFADIDFFVAGIPNNEAAWAAKFPPPGPTCSFANCDVNGDGNVAFSDIDPFVARIPSVCP